MTILDAQVAQLERELSILIYDIQDLKLRAWVANAPMFVLFQKDCRSGFLHPSCLFAFQNHAVRARMELALLEAYTELLVSLNLYHTDNALLSTVGSRCLAICIGLTEILEVSRH